MIYERGLIKGMIWKITCYDMFIIYFDWFVPKCLIILARIKYMYIAIEQEHYYFNIQIQWMHVFFKHFQCHKRKIGS
jgi:hypothetical protein